MHSRQPPLRLTTDDRHRWRRERHVAVPAWSGDGFEPKIISPAVTVTTSLVNNVVLANVPRSSGGGAIMKPTVMVWRAADGHVIKTFHGTL